MTAYILKRVAIGIVTLVFASIVIFAVLEVMPGDPARLMLGMNASADAVETLRQQMGLDQPLVLRYLHWAGGMLTGDFGKSFTYSSPVLDLIVERGAVSLPLALIALFLAAIIGIPVGVFPLRDAARPRMQPSWASPSLASPYPISGSRCS
jgi:peptide/nickel transport system permease protein